MSRTLAHTTKWITAQPTGLMARFGTAAPVAVNDDTSALAKGYVR